MELCEIRPGLRYWTAPHPEWNGATDWPEDVASVYYEAADALVLIDPLLPRGDEESLLVVLDREVERLGHQLRCCSQHLGTSAMLRYSRGVTTPSSGRTSTRACDFRSKRNPGPSLAGSTPSALEAFGRGTSHSISGRTALLSSRSSSWASTAGCASASRRH